MKRLLFAIFVFVPSCMISAQEISQDEALAVAKSFVSKTLKEKRVSSKTTSLTLAYKTGVTDNESSELYVFNKNANGGFVIVSGDSRANLILGYSDEGNFDYWRMVFFLNY